LDTNWKKSRTTVSIAPPNSIESDDPKQAEISSELPLSHPDVHIEFPGDAVETATGVGDLIETTAIGLSDKPAVPEPTRTCAVESGSIVGDWAIAQIGECDSIDVLATVVTEVAANEEVNDEPVAPGLVSTPISAAIHEESVLIQKEHGSVGKIVSTAPTSVVFQPSQRVENTQRMIREIAAAQLLQEELAKYNPNLASVASFLSKVCGTSVETQKLKDAARTAIQKGVSPDVVGNVTGDLSTEVLPAVPLVTAVTDVDQGIISTVECDEPSGPVTAVVDVDVSTRNAVNRESSMVVPSSIVETDVVETFVIDESDAVSLANTVMSVGGSSGDEDRSPSTCGSSASATGMRKRFAEESPERTPKEHSRREFPGRVTRSAGGCRVYVPTGGDTENDCPGRILNDDGTIITTVTVGQEEDILPGSPERNIARDRESSAEDAVLGETPTDATAIAASSQLPPVPSPQPLGSTPDPSNVQTLGNRHRVDTLSGTDLSGIIDGVADATGIGAVVPLLRSPVVLEPEPVRVIVLVDEWGRDTCVINEICELLESMPRPWSTYRAFEVAFAQFPNIDRAALRLAVMAVLMGQRRCVNRVTMAGIGSACAEDYRNSY